MTWPSILRHSFKAFLVRSSDGRAAALIEPADPPSRYQERLDHCAPPIDRCPTADEPSIVYRADRMVHNAMQKISVVLIEDHDLTRIGLQSALHQQGSIEVVGEARTGAQGLDLLQRVDADVAIVDIGLPVIDGIEVTRQFKQQRARREEGPRILMLTMHDGEDEVLAAFAAGADSYSIKDASIEKLIEAIEVTHSGENWIDPSIARIVLRQAQRGALDTVPVESDDARITSISALEPEYEQVMKTCALTERELEVLELIVAGCSNADIAKELYVTVGTVKTHVRSILNKLCVGDRTQAAVRALRAGLIR